MIVYRGQNVSSEQIRKFKQNIGGFLSFNNFLSTSVQRDVALSFLAGPQIGVLFEMYIDTTIGKFPFANIEHLSFQQGPNNEKEMLFSMGTVFRIVGMDTEKDFHRIQLMLTGDIDEQLADYTRRTREEIRSSSCFLSFLKLMNELKQYNNVDRFAEMFENDYSLMVNPEVLDGIHNIFGLTYHDRGQLNDALEHFHKSLAICLDTLPATHPKLAVTYNNMGVVYSAKSDFETALTYHQLALDCQTNSDNPNISSIVTYTNNIAAIYYKQDKYKEALDCHKRALELQKQYLGENDPSLSDTYNVISIICYKMDDYEQTSEFIVSFNMIFHHSIIVASFHEKAMALQEDVSKHDPESSAHCSITTGAFCLSQERYSEALEHLNRALQIQQKYFLPNNPSLADTHNYIAGVHYKQDQFEQALSNHFKALEIQQNSLGDNNPSIATSYFSISKDYVGLSIWSDALEYGLKALEQIKKSSETDVDTLTAYTIHIAQIYFQRDEYDKALSYYRKALDITLTYLPDGDSALVRVYYPIAKTYYRLKRYDEALSYFQRALNIELKTLPDNAKTISTTYLDISASYIKMDRLDEAIIAGNQAHDQLLKTLSYNHPEVLSVRELLDKLQIMLIIREGRE
jgi:tetratricopeptide (TPR) repeat protein